MNVPQITLEPRSSIHLADKAFEAIRARPAVLLPVATALTVPPALVAAYLQRSTFRSEGGVGGSFEALTQVAATDLAGRGVLVSLIGLLPLPFISAAVAYTVSAWLAGADPRAADTLRAVGRKAPALFGAWVMVHMIELVLALALVVPGVLAMAGLSVTAPVIMLEDARARAAMGRSWTLTRRRLGAVLGSVLLFALVSEVLQAAIGFLPLVASGLAPDDLRWVVLGAGSAVGSVVSDLFVGSAAVMLYLDLRVRSEGLDIMMGLRDAFPAGGPA